MRRSRTEDPAKFAHGLIRRIIEHGLERGWWSAGSYLGDPFGGVALGGIVAGYYGLNWVGVELEPRFVELGNRNIDLHRAKWKALGYDVDVQLVQGDSREFATILRRLAMIDRLEQAKGSPEQISAAITSPPYISGGHHPDQTGAWNTNGRGQGMTQDEANYGSTPGQIGRLKAGELSSVITSPPYAANPQAAPLDRSRVRDTSDPKQHGAAGPNYIQPDSPGQIGNLKAGNLDAAITSPPYAETCTDGQRENRAANLDAAGIDSKAWLGKRRCTQGRSEGYGSTPGQIGRLKAGNLDAAITSPPFVDSMSSGKLSDDMKDEMRSRGHKPSASGESASYGHTPGQIGALRAGQIEACVTSPPYEGTGLSNACDPAKKRERLQRLVAEGKITGRESVRVAQRGWNTNTQVGGQDDYGESDGQIGNSTGQTYWEAVAQVYQQVYQSLRPGGVMAVVVKDYVAKGKRVPLCDDTLKLLVSIGFEPIERVHAMLVKETVENTLFDGPVTRRRQKKSFFRRLAERRGSPRIDFEEVLVVRRKPSVSSVADSQSEIVTGKS